MLFQLLIFFASKISCSVFETGVIFLFALSFLRLKIFRLHFSQFVGHKSLLIYEQVGELGVKLRHVVHED